MRICSHCGAKLLHQGGWDRSARERAGNALEVDIFRCTGCGLSYQHRVDERFSGDIHHWWVRHDEDGQWELLDEARWPTFG